MISLLFYGIMVMADFWREIQQHKYYAWILFGVKILLVSLLFVGGLFIGRGDAGYPVTPEDLYNAVVGEEFSLEEDHGAGSYGPIEFASLLTTDVTTPTGVKDWAMYFFDVQADGFHGVGDDVDATTRDTLYNNVCTGFPGVCEKLIFVGDWTPKNKFSYAALTAYFLTRIDESLIKPYQLFPQLDSLTLRAQVSTNKSDPLCFRERRGCADHHSVTLNIALLPTYAEYVHVLVHEVGGHTVDLGVLDGTARELDTTYREFGSPAFPLDDASLGFYSLSWQGETVRKKGASMEEFCSLYGMTNMFEDFAECALMFKNHNAYFKTLARQNRTIAKKYQFFANLYSNSPIISASPRERVVGSDLTKRTRDLTKVY